MTTRTAGRRLPARSASTGTIETNFGWGARHDQDLEPLDRRRVAGRLRLAEQPDQRGVQLQPVAGRSQAGQLCVRAAALAADPPGAATDAGRQCAPGARGRWLHARSRWQGERVHRGAGRPRQRHRAVLRRPVLVARRPVLAPLQPALALLWHRLRHPHHHLRARGGAAHPRAQVRPAAVRDPRHQRRRLAVDPVAAAGGGRGGDEGLPGRQRHATAGDHRDHQAPTGMAAPRPPPRRAPARGSRPRSP